MKNYVSDVVSVDANASTFGYSCMEVVEMVEIGSRKFFGDGFVIAKRLRTLKHRATRWFLPPVRSPHGAPQQRGTPPAEEARAIRYLPRGVKPSNPLQ